MPEEIPPGMNGHERSRSTIPPWLSIVIPTFNERMRLPPALDAIHAFLMRQGWLDSTEVIVADDGSWDGTGALATRQIAQWPGLAVLLLPHAGKGAALRQGVMASHGEHLFLCDCDLSMPIEEVVRFLSPPYLSADLAIGSREAEGAQRIGEPQIRHVMGRIFNRLVRAMAVSGIDDTQCGFKRLTRTAALDLFAHLSLDGFGFDVELLALAQRRGYRIAEVPIHWYYGPDSRVRPVRDTIRMVGEVWQVRQRLRRLVAVEMNPEVEAILAHHHVDAPIQVSLKRRTLVTPIPTLSRTTREQEHDVFD